MVYNFRFSSSKCQRQDWPCHKSRCTILSGKSNEVDESQTTTRKTYFSNNQQFTDIPELDVSQPVVGITLKQNGVKIAIDLQESWSSLEMFKYICSITRIPLDLIKLINKGKIIRSDNFKAFAVGGAIFQVIGEMMEDSEGITQKDIELLMKQMKVGYNESVRALRETNNLIDAMILIGNKEAF